MNEENNKMEVEENIDPRTVEAEVIGTIRKNSIGKPKLVIGMLVIFLAVLLVLPIANKMLNDENSALYKYIYGIGQSNKASVIKQKENKQLLDATTLQLIDDKISLRYENLVIKDMKLINDTFNVSLSSYNGIYDLNTKHLYLEVYADENTLVGYYTLKGKLDNTETKYELKKLGTNYNSSRSYFVKLVSKEESDYEEVALTSDESGLASLSCTMDNREIEYNFLNGKLISIKDNENVLKGNMSDEEYTTSLKKYQDKALFYKNDNVTCLENDNGFSYQAQLDLSRINEFNDSNYFTYETNVKIVKYDQEGKGFDCK